MKSSFVHELLRSDCISIFSITYIYESPVWRSTPLGFVQGNETKIFSHHDAACELNKFDVTWVHPKIHGNLRVEWELELHVVVFKMIFLSKMWFFSGFRLTRQPGCLTVLGFLLSENESSITIMACYPPSFRLCKLDSRCLSWRRTVEWTGMARG